MQEDDLKYQAQVALSMATCKSKILLFASLKKDPALGPFSCSLWSCSLLRYYLKLNGVVLSNELELSVR